MYTLRKYFNTEKENSTPNVADFKVILSKLKEESAVVQKSEKLMPSPWFAILNIHKNVSRVYAYSAIGFAALILMVITNTSNTNTPAATNLAMNTQPVNNTQMKSTPVNDAINVVDSVNSFGEMSQ